jgi:hypothetical protein
MNNQPCNHIWHQPQDAYQPECRKCGLMKSTVESEEKKEYQHDKNCVWAKTTESDCSYKSTHHYCPHPEHQCSCIKVQYASHPMASVSSDERINQHLEYRVGYRTAIDDAKEILRKNWDEECVDYANPLPDIIKILETLNP